MWIYIIYSPSLSLVITVFVPGRENSCSEGITEGVWRKYESSRGSGKGVGSKEGLGKVGEARREEGRHRRITGGRERRGKVAPAPRTRRGSA